MLRDSLTYKLASIADGAISDATRLFRGRFGWDVYEIRVLRVVRDNPGITFTDLAALTRFERSATSRILVRLAKAGLVRRESSEQDARRYFLTVTKDGAAICRDADPLTAELEALMLEPLSPADRRKLLESIETVLAWVQGDYRAEVRKRFPEA